MNETMERANIINIYKNETDSWDHGNQPIPSSSQGSIVSPVLTLKLEDSGDVCHTAGQACEENCGSHQMTLDTKVDAIEAPDSIKYVCGYCGLMYCLQGDYLHHLNKQHGCDITQAKLELDNSDISSLPINMDKIKTEETSPLDIKAESEPVTNTRLDILTNEEQKQHKCDVCGRAFGTGSHLKQHMRTHTGEKPYKCDVCGKAFARACHLKSHFKTHTGERPYNCDVCGKAFAHNSMLKRHMVTHTGEKPYKCDVCGKAFAHSKSLQGHMRTHTGELLRCDVCGRGFTQSCELTKHTRIHTGERPYKCDVCGNEFTQATHLDQHMRTHTGEKPFKCDVCGTGFTQYSGLRYHKQNDVCGSQGC